MVRVPRHHAGAVGGVEISGGNCLRSACPYEEKRKRRRTALKAQESRGRPEWHEQKRDEEAEPEGRHALLSCLLKAT